MRGRRAAWASVVALVVLLGATLAACTAGDERSSSSGGATGSATEAGDGGDPTRVPRAFVSGADDGWSLVGATDDALVGLGGNARDADRFGQTFDLETGEVAEIPPPPFDDDRPVQVDEAVFGASTVILDAFVYGPGVDADTTPVNSSEVPPTEILSYRLDVRERTWERLLLPPPFGDQDRFAMWEIEPTGPDGAVAYLAAPTGGPVLALVEEDGWKVVAREGVADRAASTACATDTEWWQVETGPADTTVSAVSLVDGSRRDVAVPPILSDGEWEVVLPGCTADLIVLAVGDTTEHPATVFVSMDGMRWEERPDALGETAFFSLIEDGPGGVVLPAIDMDPVDGEPAPRSAVVGPAGDTAELDASVGEDLLVWRGRQPTYLVIGRNDVDAEGTVPLREVQAP